MNELEQKMANILNELGVSFESQYEVGEQYYPARCRSKYGCVYKQEDDCGEDDDLAECTQDEYYGEDCEWYLPSVVYPLYILDFALFVGNSKVCIECDGFLWHRAFEWQKRDDAKRDVWLKNQGWLIKRFAGGTIITHRSKIKKELQEYLDSLKPKLQQSFLGV